MEVRDTKRSIGCFRNARSHHPGAGCAIASPSSAKEGNQTSNLQAAPLRLNIHLKCKTVCSYLLFYSSVKKKSVIISFSKEDAASFAAGGRSGVNKDPHLVSPLFASQGGESISPPLASRRLASH